MENQHSMRVMHVIARMNVRGPAVLVADLMRSVDSRNFEQVLSWISHSLISIGANVMNDLLQVGIGRAGKFHVIFPGL